MRIILAGQRSFGMQIFRDCLLNGHEVAAVWSPEDDSPLTQTARARGLWVPPIQRNPKSVQALEVDLFVAAHSHDFIGRESRTATRLGGIGYHPSLLPRHRGRDAVRWTIQLRDPIAGGSVYWLTDQVDGGPIAAQSWCFVDPSWTASDLWRKKLFGMGRHLIGQVLRDLGDGLLVQEPQDPTFATWEPSWDRPPLYRPELPQIGDGPDGFQVLAHRGASRR